MMEQYIITHVTIASIFILLAQIFDAEEIHLFPLMLMVVTIITTPIHAAIYWLIKAGS